MTVLLARRDVRDYFRVQASSLESATHVVVRFPIREADEDTQHIEQSIESGRVDDQPLNVFPAFFIAQVKRIAHKIMRLREEERQTLKVEKTKNGGQYYFTSRCHRYLLHWDLRMPHLKCVEANPCLHVEPAVYMSMRDGLNGADYDRKLETNGPNLIPFRARGFFQAISDELCSPFFVYQMIVYITWAWTGYIFVGISLLSVVIICGVVRAYIQRTSEVSAKWDRHMRLPPTINLFTVNCFILP